MGLKSRHRSTTAAVGNIWQPLTGEVEYVLDDQEAGDDGEAGSHGYAVTFYLASAPGATLTVCVYVAGPTASPAPCCLGYCGDYVHSAGPADEPWAATAYHYGADLYTDLNACDQAAHEHAEELAAIGCSAPSAAGLPFFSWDGVPW